MGEQSEPEEAAQEMAFKQVFLLQLFAFFLYLILFWITSLSTQIIH